MISSQLDNAISERLAQERTQREAFDRATYYDCGDGDELTYETAEEAIEYELEQCATKDCDMAALIRERCPLTVDAFKRNVVSESWVRATAERVAEDIGEQFDLTYASAADEPKAVIGAPGIAAACEAAVWAVVNASEVYNCTEVAQRTYSAEEVEAMMRETRPDWFGRESDRAGMIEIAEAARQHMRERGKYTDDRCERWTECQHGACRLLRALERLDGKTLDGKMPRCCRSISAPGEVPYQCARPAGHSGAHSSHPEAGDAP